MKHKYIDLHIHTYCSDGMHSLSKYSKLLKKQAQLYFCFRPRHRDRLYELANPDIRRIYIGTIIPGIEITTSYRGEIV